VDAPINPVSQEEKPLQSPQDKVHYGFDFALVYQITINVRKRQARGDAAFDMVMRLNLLKFTRFESSFNAP